jgi:acyl-CoA thioesterase-1
MNPVVLQFANGNVFFLGMVMVMGAAGFCLQQNGRVIKCVMTIDWLVGILLVILSATPLPPWLYGAWLILSLAGLMVLNRGDQPRFSPRSRWVTAGCVILPSLILVLDELPRHLDPSFAVSSAQPVFVIGDSLAAGIGSKERVWPEVLAERAHLKVANLAQPGANVEAALKQAARIDKRGALVIVEIGGNDLLGGTDRQLFHQQLEALLSQVTARGCQVVMFELPLIPFHNSFGSAQRSLAKKYHATLLPKRFLTKVFGMAGGTLDGLHLSQSGHDALAGEIQGVMRLTD